MLDLNDMSRIRILRDWKWCKGIWDSTMIQYKAVLKEWYKGTGGGSGLVVEFETWDTTQFEKYSIDLDSYDHCDVESGPAILMHLY